MKTIRPMATMSRIRTSAVEFALKRAPPLLARREAPGDAPELRRGADGDDDPLAAATDHAGPRVGERMTACERGVLRIGFDPAVFGDRLAGQDAPVDEEPVGPGDPHVRRNDVAGLEQDDVARHERGCGDGQDVPVAADSRSRSRRLAERLERALAAVLRDDVRSDDRQQGDEDEDAVAHLADERSARMPAAASMMMNGSMNASTTIRQSGSRFASSSAFGPAFPARARGLARRESPSRVHRERRCDVRRGLGVVLMAHAGALQRRDLLPNDMLFS